MEVDEDAEIEAALLREQEEAEAVLSRPNKKAKVAVPPSLPVVLPASRHLPPKEEDQDTIVLGSSSDLEVDERPASSRSSSTGRVKMEVQAKSSGSNSRAPSAPAQSSSTSVKAEIIDISDSD
jgi:hypothetical protein